MKKTIRVCLLLILVASLAQGEGLSTTHQFFDFEFGITTETFGIIASKKLGIDYTAGTNASMPFVRDDEMLLVPVDDQCIRYGGYPFFSSFAFTSNALSAVHLFWASDLYLETDYELTPQDFFLHQIQAAALFSDLVTRLERHYGSSTEEWMISLGKKDADRWLFPSQAHLLPQIIEFLQHEEFAYVAKKFGNVSCYLIKTQLSSTQEQPYCIIWITYQEDGLNRSLSVQIEEFENMLRTHFSSAPTNAYMPVNRIDSRSDEALITIESMKYIVAP